MPCWTAKGAFIRVRINVSFRSSYVTSILITKLAFAVFAQTEYIIRCYFSLCFISFVAFMWEVNRSFSIVFFFSIRYLQMSISDIDKFILILFNVRLT